MLLLVSAADQLGLSVPDLYGVVMKQIVLLQQKPSEHQSVFCKPTIGAGGAGYYLFKSLVANTSQIVIAIRRNR